MPARLYRAKPLGLGARIRGIVSGLGCLALIGCDALPTGPSTTPQPRPPGLNAPTPKPINSATPSAASEELAFYYAKVQQSLKAQDLMRSDGGGVDTPFTKTNLAQNFEDIVFYQEYASNRGLELSDGESYGLQKWDKPIRFALEFGSTVPPKAQIHDTEIVRNYAKRLSKISGHPVHISGNKPNFFILVMGEDDRERTLQRALEISPLINQISILNFMERTKTISCVIFTFSEGESDYTPDIALAIIRSELPADMRKACYHEELAQGLGLANDSPDARPSIFNDDEEFALLTTHDEELLRLLYNPALTPGMSVEQARPIVNQILLSRAGPG